MLKFRFLFLITLSLAPFILKADVLKEAELAYDGFDYKKSVSLYEEALEQSGPSGELLFNLGNAYFRLGLTGKAMAAYLGAKRFLPRDSDVEQNLSHVHSLSKDKLNFESSYGFFGVFLSPFKRVSLYETKSFFLWAWLVFAAVLLASFFISSLKSFKDLFLFLWMISFCLYFAMGSSLLSSSQWGAVISEKAQVRSGPGKVNTVLFELNEAAPVLQKDERNNWYKIELSDGKKGWVSKNEVLFF